MTYLQKHTDEALMDLLQKGSTSAFDEIYARYSKKLLAFVYRLVNGNEALAQDILHDVFLKIIENPKAFDTRKKLKPWLYTVAANAGRKAHRKPITVELTDTVDTKLGSAYQPNLSDQKGLDTTLNKALNQLSEEHKAVFVLKHQQYMSIKEIAEILKIPEGTVKSRLYTATKKLARTLKHLNPKKTI